MTTEQEQRYSRQISVKEIGESGQNRLLCSTVAVVGCGALGSMVAIQLAAAGVGKILIADFDTIDISNLQRQFFFNTTDAGKKKADILASRIYDLNPECVVEIVPKLVNRTLGEELFKNCDFIIDATDNPSSKIMIEEICAKIGKICCIGGVADFHGQIMTICPGGTTFKELFCPQTDIEYLPCSLGGVMGPAAAVCASIQSSEAIKYLTGIPTTLKDKLLSFDLLTDSFTCTSLNN